MAPAILMTVRLLPGQTMVDNRGAKLSVCRGACCLSLADDAFEPANLNIRFRAMKSPKPCSRHTNLE